MRSTQLAAHEFGCTKEVVKIVGVELHSPSLFLGGANRSFLHPCAKPCRISPLHESAGILLSVRPMLTPVPTIATSSPRRAESMTVSTPSARAGREGFLREDFRGIQTPSRLRKKSRKPAALW